MTKMKKQTDIVLELTTLEARVIRTVLERISSFDSSDEAKASFDVVNALRKCGVSNLGYCAMYANTVYLNFWTERNAKRDVGLAKLSRGIE